MKYVKVSVKCNDLDFSSFIVPYNKQFNFGCEEPHIKIYLKLEKMSKRKLKKLAKKGLLK